ncbi:MAG: hypothetical protein CMF49_08395 [Legionellales bacterium]|nr:hypothetical protein [Legionellales bacterium]
MANKILREYVVSEPIVDLSALKAFDTTNLQDGVMANVQNFGIVRFDQRSSVAANDISIIEPTTGGGRWYKVTTSFTGNVFTVSGDGTADFTELDDALQALGQNDGEIYIVGDFTATTSNLFNVNPAGQNIKIHVYADVDFGAQNLIIALNAGAGLNLEVVGNGSVTFAETAITNSLIVFQNNGGGDLGLPSWDGVEINNNSTTAGKNFFSNSALDIKMSNATMYIPDLAGCGISCRNFIYQDVTLVGGGSACTLALVAQGTNCSGNNLILDGQFLASSSLSTSYDIRIKGNINGVQLINPLGSGVLLIGNVNNVSGSTTGDHYVGVGGDISVEGCVSNVQAPSFNLIAISSLSKFVNMSGKQLQALNGSVGYCEFANVRISDTYFTSIMEYSRFVNCTFLEGVFLNADNQTLVNVDTLGGGNRNITINTNIRECTIVNAQTELPIVNNSLSNNNIILNNIVNDPDWKYFRPTDDENYVINGGFDVWQRGTSFTAPNNNTYVADRWLLLSDGNGVVDVSKESTITPEKSSNSIKFSVNTANVKFGVMQILSHQNSKPLIADGGGDISVQAKIKLDGTSTTFRIYVLEWQGTADGLTSATRDPISAWNNGSSNPTLNSNWALCSPLSSITVFNTDGFYEGTVKVNGITPSSSANNLAVLIIYNNIGNDISGDNVYFADVKLESNSASSLYNQPKYEETLARCMSYYCKSYNIDTAPGTVTGDGQINIRSTSTGSLDSDVFFKQPMFLRNTGGTDTPAITFYSPVTGAADNVRNKDTVADEAATTFDNISQNNASTLSGTFTALDNFSYHYTADAEF